MRKKIFSVLMTILLLFGLFGCNNAGVSYSSATTEIDPYDMDELYTICLDDLTNREDLKALSLDFALKFFNQSYIAGENNLISPLSLELALAILAMGTAGESRNEITNAFLDSENKINFTPKDELMELIYDELITWISQYQGRLLESENTPLKISNSLWFRNEENRLELNKDYIYRIHEYFNSKAYSAPFDDSTVKDINKWCKDATDGQINEILDEIPKEAVLYIFNALSFDGKWEVQYEDFAIDNEGVFYNQNGSKSTCDMMYSTESILLKDDNSIGFVKPYKDGFSFVGLLPIDEKKSIDDFIKSIDGDKWRKLFEEKNFCSVDVAIPVFKEETAIKLSSILNALGIKEIFDPNLANLSNMGKSEQGNLFISRALQKVTMDVNPKGTKAAAITVFETSDGCAFIEDYFQVYLDRPFVYAIIDDATNMPVFIGSIAEIK